MLKIIKHPLIEIKLTTIRDASSDHAIFKKNLSEISSLMVYEILRDYKTKAMRVKTPNRNMAIGATFDKDIVIVPILRAGLGMAYGIETLIPQVRTGHIGLYRDENDFSTHTYFCKLPQVNKDAEVIILDPMLATGSSAIAAINILKKEGFTNIKLACIIGSPEGVNAVGKAFPMIDVYLAALDAKLDSKKYIIPGLGDAGDRIFGTK